MPQDARHVMSVNGETVLVLREASPVERQRHRCSVQSGDRSSAGLNWTIIQCKCGRRYKCRKSYFLVNGNDDPIYVWVRRILPRPPKQNWPRRNPVTERDIDVH